MSGFCSAHQHHEPGCQQCEALPMSDSELLKEAVATAIASCSPFKNPSQLHYQQADAAITAIRKEEERQATDRDAKAVAVDDIKLALRMRASSGDVSGERREDARMFLDLLDDIVEQHRQRLNVNPNLVSIERGTVPEWFETFRDGGYADIVEYEGPIYFIPNSETGK